MAERTERRLHLIGAGGHGCVVIATAKLLGYTVAAVYDDSPARVGTTLMDVPVRSTATLADVPPGEWAFVSVGDNGARESIVQRWQHLQWVSLVHPAAFVDAEAEIGVGTIVCAGAVVQPGAVVGAHAIINTSASVDHHCHVGTFAHIAPGANVAGSARVGRSTLLGAGSVVLPGRTIGHHTVVGAGACVTSDVPDHVTVTGAPARPLAREAGRVSKPLRSDDSMTAAVNRRIYLSPPHWVGDEHEWVHQTLEALEQHPDPSQIFAFEHDFAQAVGVSHAVAVSSGTAALHLALRLSGVGAGDDVLVSTFTFCASVNPILYQEARPVFLDSERVSWNLDPDLLEDVLKARAEKNALPKALVLVHLYGQSADLGAIGPLCERYGVTLVEDAAEALGATYEGRAPGTFGKAGIYSFNGNKIITTSGGGMLVTEDAALAQHARKLATQARDAAPHYQHSEVGYNYRLSNVLAGVGRGQLRVLEDRVVARRENFAAYREAFDDVSGIGFMPEAPWGRHSRWLSCITVDSAAFGATREEVRLALEAQNIEVRPLWKPMHLQPAYAGYEAHLTGVAEGLFEVGLCLPSGSNLTAEERQRVIDGVRACYQRSVVASFGR